MIAAMSLAPTLQTARLKLRQIREDDVHDIFDYARNPNVLRFTMAQTPTKFEDCIPFVRDAAHKPEDVYAWSMCLKDTDRVIGVIEFNNGGAVASVHFAMGKTHWNRGLMTEAVQKILQWAFDTYPTMTEVRTSAVIENVGSRRVLEKCGMQQGQTVQEKWEKQTAPVTLVEYFVRRGKNVAETAHV
jgi:[ribosomal protein S5]-alanine N-acetyltransferase